MYCSLGGCIHYDVIKWKHFRRYWPFVRGIHGFDVFFDLRLNTRLSKQSRHRWFETTSRSLWHPCNVSDSEDITQLIFKFTPVSNTQATLAAPVFYLHRIDQCRVSLISIFYAILESRNNRKCKYIFLCSQPNSVCKGLKYCSSWL